jgi:hypothetical protein
MARSTEDQDLIFDAMRELEERLRWHQVLRNDRRIDSLIGPITAVVIDAAQGRSMHQHLDQIAAMAKGWWDGGPIWPDQGPTRTYGPYPETYRHAVAEVFNELADLDLERDLPQIKSWFNAEPEVALLATPSKPLWAISLDDIEWRDYGNEAEPCLGIRSTITDIDLNDHLAWCARAKKVIAETPGD